MKKDKSVVLSQEHEIVTNEGKMAQLEEVISQLEDRNKGLQSGILKENSVNQILKEIRERCRQAEENLRQETMISEKQRAEISIL